MREDTGQPNSPHQLETVYLEACPKCRFALPDAQPECGRCGLIYAKYRPPHIAPTLSITEHSVDDGSTWRQHFLSVPPIFHPFTFAARVILLFFLIIWGWRFITSAIESGYAMASFLHLVNLAFHEAGHVFFGFFGRFVMSLGGTLGQILMPTICLLVLFIKTRDAFGAAVALWWVGQNFMDIAPYVNDARARQLMLLGGVTGRDAAYGYHDWEFILSETGLLRYDHILAYSANGLGIILMLAALLWAGSVLLHQWRQRRLPPH